MKVDLSSYAAAFRTLPPDVREAEVNGVYDEELQLEVSGGRIGGSHSFRRTRLYVRASADRTGMVYIEKLDEDPHEVIAQAARNSSYLSAGAPDPMNDGTRPLRILDERKPESAEELLAYGAELERGALAREGVASVDRCVLRRSIYGTRTVNSKGLDAYAENSFVTVALGVSLKRARTGRPVTGTATLSARGLSRLEPERLIGMAIAEADLQDGGGTLEPCSVASGTYPAVLSSTVVRNILTTAWLEFSGERMQSGTSIFPGKAGTRVGSQLLSITHAPGHPLVGHYLPVDCEGTVCNETAIVRGGELVKPLHTLASARRAGQAPTGSAGRVAQMTGVVPINITTVPAVIYIEPGDCSQQDLITKMRDGLFLTYSLDLYHSINLTSGDFSIPCGGGYYQNGRLVGTVDQMVMAGNLRELFENIRAVGDDLRFDEFYFRNYSYGGPSLLVTGLAFGR